MAIPFITIPGIIYSISRYILLIILLPIGFVLGRYSMYVSKTSSFRASVRADAIAVKIVPIFLVFFIPFILYSYDWETLGLIFFAWFAVYFILQRHSGILQRHSQMAQAKEWDYFIEDWSKWSNRK